jgi:hypothetical protein
MPNDHITANPFDELPDELIDLIAFFVRREDLAAFALTCNRFQEAAAAGNPFAYFDIPLALLKKQEESLLKFIARVEAQVDLHEQELPLGKVSFFYVSRSYSLRKVDKIFTLGITLMGVSLLGMQPLFEAYPLGWIGGGLCAPIAFRAGLFGLAQLINCPVQQKIYHLEEKLGALRDMQDEVAANIDVMQEFSQIQTADEAEKQRLTLKNRLPLTEGEEYLSAFWKSKETAKLFHKTHDIVIETSQLAEVESVPLLKNSYESPCLRY